MGSANSYFKDLFNNTSDLIHFVDADGIVEMVNPAWLSKLGYTSEEVKGRSIYDFISDEDKPLYLYYRNACIAQKNQENIGVTFISSNGNSIVLEGHLRPFFSEGKLLHTRGVFRDITLKREQEKIQKDQLYKTTQFLQNAPDAVVIIDEHQRVSEWNLKATEIFGYTREEVLNQPLAQFIIPLEFREAHHRGMQHFLKTGQGPVLNKTIEVPAINKAQQEFPISLSISNVKVNNAWHFIAFMSDISEKKRREQALVQKELELERSKQEDQRNKDFLSIASHELKTPLTNLKAYLQLALKGFESGQREQAKKFLTKADNFSDKLTKLIFDLLDVSKIQAGKLMIQKQPTEISQMLQDIVRSSQLLYPSHTIFLETQPNIVANIDTGRIEQVVVNLISNAVKYSPKANRVEISCEERDSNCYLRVKDFGIGIKQTNYDKVFDKFYRIEELSKNDTQGLGIGLYVSSEIINQHGGKIWVESNEGAGTTFVVLLPLGTTSSGGS
ncbi:PAS domain-containing sensor histidine kinase [Pedobacter sp. SYSU D00535]|uniref:PAS domain-containing sensor histidine kinase n=1 Tax=Pedobacter sp. SYSU D00535 TaxID=2810308 RepID=UPI001A9594AA